MKKSTFDLQPMSLGDILDRAVRLYRRHFLHTVGIVSVPYILIVPVSAAIGSVSWVTGDPRALFKRDLIAFAVLMVVALVWLSFMSMGALARSVSERFLGEEPTVWGSYRSVLRRTLSLIWAYLLAFLAWGGVGFLGAVVIGIATVVSRLLLVLGVIAVFVVSVTMFFRLLLVTQVIMVENVRGVAALRRSWTLMRGNFWRAVLILIFAFVVGLVMSFVLQLPFSLLARARPNPAYRILGTVMGQLAQIVSVPFGSIAFTLLYYDGRIRQEAFDLEMMAQNLGVSTSPSSPSEIATPSHPTPPPPGAPATADAQPTGPPRPFGAFKVCPQCGARVPNIQPNCGKCGTRVPFRPAIR